MNNFNKIYMYEEIPCRVITIFEHTNKVLGSKLVALIFYLGKRTKDSEEDKGIFRYVEVKDLQITQENTNYIGSSYDLMKQYGGEFYEEDRLYNFVCYDGIKI